jgi:hypothetical protein
MPSSPSSRRRPRRRARAGGRPRRPRRRARSPARAARRSRRPGRRRCRPSPDRASRGVPVRGPRLGIARGRGRAISVSGPSGAESSPIPLRTATRAPSRSSAMASTSIPERAAISPREGEDARVRAPAHRARWPSAPGRGSPARRRRAARGISSTSRRASRSVSSWLPIPGRPRRRRTPRTAPQSTLIDASDGVPDDVSGSGRTISSGTTMPIRVATLAGAATRTVPQPTRRAARGRQDRGAGSSGSRRRSGACRDRPCSRRRHARRAERLEQFRRDDPGRCGTHGSACSRRGTLEGEHADQAGHRVALLVGETAGIVSMRKDGVGLRQIPNRRGPVVSAIVRPPRPPRIVLRVPAARGTRSPGSSTAQPGDTASRTIAFR